MLSRVVFPTVVIMVSRRGYSSTRRHHISAFLAVDVARVAVLAAESRGYKVVPRIVVADLKLTCRKTDIYGSGYGYLNGCYRRGLRRWGQRK